MLSFKSAAAPFSTRLGMERTQSLQAAAGKSDASASESRPKALKQTTFTKGVTKPTAKPAARKITVPETLEDGFTAHPPSIIYKQFGEPVLSPKVAAFDFDGTLISSRSGRNYAVSVHDWVMYNDQVVTGLQQYHEEGYRIVVFTNQGGIKSAMAGATSIIVRGKISNFMASMNDVCRKPQPGMWHFMCSHLSGEVQPDVSQSFMVGDNHNGADEGFAASVGLPYRTELEEFGPPGEIPPLPRTSSR